MLYHGCYDFPEISSSNQPLIDFQFQGTPPKTKGRNLKKSHLKRRKKHIWTRPSILWGFPPLISGRVSLGQHIFGIFAEGLTTLRFIRWWWLQQLFLRGIYCHPEFIAIPAKRETIWWINLEIHMSHEKKPLTFHYTGCLIGIRRFLRWDIITPYNKG